MLGSVRILAMSQELQHFLLRLDLLQYRVSYVLCCYNWDERKLKLQCTLLS